LADAAAEALGVAQLRLATLAIDAAKHLVRVGRKRVAVLVDDVFQAIGVDRAATYVKALLGLIEHPPQDADAIVAIAATSEGITRREIGRHMWADLTPMWNMAREGFKQLYEQLPGEKPSFEEVWRVTGGNPRLLGILYEAGWDVDVVVERLVEEKELTLSFVSRWRKWLEAAPREGSTPLDRRTPAGEGPRTRHRQTRSMANTATQRSREAGTGPQPLTPLPRGPAGQGRASATFCATGLPRLRFTGWRVPRTTSTLPGNTSIPRVGKPSTLKP